MEEDMNWKRIFFLITLMSFLTPSGYTCINGDGYFPKNDLNIPPHVKSRGGVTQAQFNQILDKVHQIYEPIVRNYGGNLVINKKWNDGTVNAMAYRQGSTYMVDMFGGLARHERMTPDGLMLVACHEVGHHIGGAPHYKQSGGEWASNEGQSDYFATTKCMRKVLMNEDNENIIRTMTIDPVAREKCEDGFSAGNDQAICMRIAMAGMAGSSMFASMSNGAMPRFDRPDTSQVSQTYDSHPHYQCRLDTYHQGSICSVDEDVDIGQQDPNEGTCNRPDGFTEGLRPLCWYKPTSGGGGGNPPPTNDELAQTPTVNGQTTIVSTNPNFFVPISIDVRDKFPSGAAGFALEISKPNVPFSNPNGNAPDRINGLGHEVYMASHGVYNLLPARQLPAWGIYQIRVIAVDGNRNAVGRFSHVLTLRLLPGAVSLEKTVTKGHGFQGLFARVKFDGVRVPVSRDGGFSTTIEDDGTTSIDHPFISGGY